MFRKVLAVLFAISLTVAMLCSCSPSIDEPSNTGGVSNTDPVETPSGDASGEIDLSYPIVDDKLNVTGMIISDNMDLKEPRQTWVNLEELTNIHIDWETVNSDAAAVYFASNDWADIVMYNAQIPNEIMADYGILGHRFVDYKDYLDYMPNLVKTIEDYPTADKVVTEIDGGMYQLPYIGNDCTAVTARMYYRQDTLADAGCEVPTTTEEFYEVLKTLKEYNNGAAPFAEAALEFLWSSFGPGKCPDFEDDGTGTVIYNRTTDQYKLYLEYMAKLYEEGLLHKEYLTLESSTLTSMAQESELVFGNDGVRNLAEDSFESGKVEITQLTPLTSEYDNERIVIGWNYARPCGVAIKADCKYIPELCRMFDVAYATEEVVEDLGLYGISFCYGIENEHWSWTNDEHTEYELILPEEFEGVKAFGVFQYENLIYYNIGRFDTFKNATTVTEGNNKARQQGFVKNLIPYQEEVAFPGSYLKFTEEEQEVLNNKWTSIQEYINQSMSEFIAGIRDVDTEWDSYVTEVNNMGIEDVLAAYQAAYERFNE